MAIEYIKHYYVAPNIALGNYYGNWSGVSDEQKVNAIRVYNHFINNGWNAGAVCGMIGNMQKESSLNPGLVEGGGRQYCPGNATDLTLLTNSVMLDFYKAAHPEYTGTGNPFGLGIVQWTGPSQITTVPYGQKMVSHVIRNCNDTPWYWGDNQLSRIDWEQANNGQWQSATINGTLYTWSNFINISDPQLAAHVWMVCYERPEFTEESLAQRKQNAQQWYDYLTNSPVPPPTPGTPLPPVFLFMYNKYKRKVIKRVRI